MGYGMAKDPLKTLKNRAHQSKRTLLIAFLASHVCYLTCVNRTFTTCSATTMLAARGAE